MPRPRGYDLDELLAAWGSGDFTTAAAVMEFLSIPSDHLRSVRANIRHHFGSRPKRPSARGDWTKAAILKYLVDVCSLHANYCSQHHGFAGFDVYLRQTGREDDLQTIIIVCKRCKRVGDV